MEDNKYSKYLPRELSILDIICAHIKHTEKLEMLKKSVEDCNSKLEHYRTRLNKES